jgi:hypothetical protein
MTCSQFRSRVALENILERDRDAAPGQQTTTNSFDRLTDFRRDGTILPVLFLKTLMEPACLRFDAALRGLAGFYCLAGSLSLRRPQYLAIRPPGTDTTPAILRICRRPASDLPLVATAALDPPGFLAATGPQQHVSTPPASKRRRFGLCERWPLLAQFFLSPSALLRALAACYRTRCYPWRRDGQVLPVRSRDNK